MVPIAVLSGFGIGRRVCHIEQLKMEVAIELTKNRIGVYMNLRTNSIKNEIIVIYRMIQVDSTKKMEKRRIPSSTTFETPVRVVL